jgi:CheY-like chemotaxis protein
MGFGKVRVVEDGLQAIEAVEQSLPHLILMDIEMPRMNGPE